MFAVCDCSHSHLSAELDLSGGIDNGIDVVGLANQHRVVGNGVPANCDGLF